MRLLSGVSGLFSGTPWGRFPRALAGGFFGLFFRLHTLSNILSHIILKCSGIYFTLNFYAVAPRVFAKEFHSVAGMSAYHTSCFMAHFMKALGPGADIQGNDKILILLK
jgi:hypothetical protein